MTAGCSVALPQARTALLEELDQFLAVAGGLQDHALVGPSRAHGWSRLDCLVHVRMGLQELLAGIPCRTDIAPEVDAASYWVAWEASAALDPVPGILLTRRIASAYDRPTQAVEDLRQVAAGLRPSATAMPDAPVWFQGHSISAGDLLATWAVELALHQHDLDAPGDETGPAPSALRIGRRTAEALHDGLGSCDDDLTVMLRGFGRA